MPLSPAPAEPMTAEAELVSLYQAYRGCERRDLPGLGRAARVLPRVRESDRPSGAGAPSHRGPGDDPRLRRDLHGAPAHQFLAGPGTGSQARTPVPAARGPGALRAERARHDAPLLAPGAHEAPRARGARDPGSLRARDPDPGPDSDAPDAP